MILIYPKKCKKSNKSKKKVVDLGCTRGFHFFKVLKSTKKEPFLISYFLLEAPWDAWISISSSSKHFQATYTFADAWTSWTRFCKSWTMLSSNTGCYCRYPRSASGDTRPLSRWNCRVVSPHTLFQHLPTTTIFMIWDYQES